MTARHSCDLDQGRLHWFGADWGGWLCQECPHIPTPVGEPCLWCSEPIERGDRGVMQLYLSHDDPPGRRALHYACHVRSVVGGLNHLEGRCPCYGGTEPADPPGLSRREAAERAALTAWLMSEEGALPSAHEGRGARGAAP